MYPDGDIDKLLARGETASMDPELRDALDRLTADLRAEIRSGDAETRRHVDDRFEAVQRQFEHVDERFETVQGQFEHVDERFETVQGRFEHVDEQFEALQGRFEHVDEQFEALQGQFEHVDERFEAVQRRFEEFQVHVDERFAEMRRHFDVVAESFRGDIRSLAELMAISNERTDGRINEQAGRLDGIDSRVLGLEVRVTRLEDDRRSRRPRRQR